MLKTIFNCKFRGRFFRRRGAHYFFLFLLVFISVEKSSLAAPAADEAGRTTQRLAQVVDYVAADYAGAVRDGQIIEPSEFNEQLELIREARKLLPALSGREADRATLAAELLEVEQAVESRTAPAEVQRRCRIARQTLKDVFHLRLLPAEAVDAARGAELYKSLCVSCHGATGQADTAAAAALKPPPLSFHDGERMSRVSPALAFHALTFGISGTAMAPFDRLSAQERWHLAFYVVALRHGQPGQTAAPPHLPSELLARLGSVALLAELSDEELTAELLQAGQPPASVPAFLAYLRSTAPFVHPAEDGTAERHDTFARARSLVNDSLAAAQGGRFAEAHRLAIAAYLDGIEPHEAALRIARPELLSRIEAAFSALRHKSDPDKNPSAAAMAKEAQLISTLLTEAGHEKAGKGGALKAFLASLVIALREGLEVALLIAALLAFLRKSGQAALARSVHVGWLLSIPAGLLTFALVGKIVDGARRELAEGVLTLCAAAILLSVTHFVLGAKEARHFLGFLRRRVEAVGQVQARPARDKAVWLFGIAFFAAYREALETALFYRALLLDVGAGGWQPVLWGIVIGVAALAILVVTVGRIGRKLNPRPVMLASSALLALLALSLTGHGISALQEGGYLGMSPVMFGETPFSGLPALGIYPTWQGLGAQAVVVVLLVLPSLIDKIRLARSAAQERSLPQPTGA